jgi:hypothetical protein
MQGCVAVGWRGAEGRASCRVVWLWAGAVQKGGHHAGLCGCGLARCRSASIRQPQLWRRPWRCAEGTPSAAVSAVSAVWPGRGARERLEARSRDVHRAVTRGVGLHLERDRLGLAEHRLGARVAERAGGGRLGGALRADGRRGSTHQKGVSMAEHGTSEDERRRVESRQVKSGGVKSSGVKSRRAHRARVVRRAKSSQVESSQVARAPSTSRRRAPGQGSARQPRRA